MWPEARTGRSLLLLAIAVACAGCSRGKPPPAPLSSDDSCALCRMAVSQPRFAAQIALGGGRAEFFDDLGCLIRRIRGSGVPEGAVVYVADFQSGRWIEAAAATYLRSPGVSTPMSSGLIAFADRTAAVAAARQHRGKLLAFKDLQLPGHDHFAGGH